MRTAHELEPSSPLSPEWRRWLVENLLRGTSPRALVATLEGAGVAADTAHRALEAEKQDPFVLGAMRAVGMQHKLEGLLDVYAELFGQTDAPPRVDRHAGLPPERFFADYYFENLPVVLRDDGWSAALDREAWTPARVAALLGEEDARRPGWVPLFEDARLEPLTRGLTTPRGIAAPEARACESRLWWEPAGADVPLRPARRNVLLGQVHGTRAVRLVPAFELRRMTSPPGEGPGPLTLEVTLGAGELLLLPVGWWYGFGAPEAGVGVSFEAFALPEPNVTWDMDARPLPTTPPPRE